MSKRNLKAIFWDNDGVLVDTETLYLKATRQSVSTLQVELTTELFIKHFMEASSGLDSLLIDFDKLVISETRKKRNEIYSELLKRENLLIDGVLDVLKVLSDKFRMGIVTSCKEDHFSLIHANTNILDYFDFILTAKDYDFEKPHPASYLKALEVSGLTVKDCLVIEDSVRGLKSAKSAGIPCCVVKSSFTRAWPIEGADFCVNTVAELPTLINDNFLV